MKSMITRLGTNNNNSSTSPATKGKDASPAATKGGGASILDAKQPVEVGGASKQLPAQDGEVQTKLRSKVDNAGSIPQTQSGSAEPGPRKKITVSLGKPIFPRKEPRKKLPNRSSGGNSPIFEEKKIPLPGELHAKTPEYENHNNAVIADNGNHSPKKENDDSSKSGLVSFTFKNHSLTMAPTPDTFTNEQIEEKETETEVKKFRSTFSEASSISTSNNDANEVKPKMDWNVFVKVRNKDDTLELDWPKEMIKFTDCEPSISYSCNPLSFDFSELLGKPSKVKSELDLLIGKENLLVKVDADVKNIEEEFPQEETTLPDEDHMDEVKVPEKEKKKSKHKKKKKKHHKEGEDESKEDSKKSEKKKKKKKKRKKHRRSDKEKKEQKIEQEENMEKNDAEPMKCLENIMEKSNKSDGESGDVEESEGEDTKPKKNKHKKHRKSKKSKKKKKHHHDNEEEDKAKKENKEMDKGSDKPVVQESRDPHSTEDKESRKKKKKHHHESDLKVKNEKLEDSVSERTECENKRKHVSDDSDANDNVKTPKVEEKLSSHSSRSPAVAKDIATKKTRKEGGSGSDRRNSSLRKRQTSESSVNEATPVKRQKVTPRLIPEEDAKSQDTWSKMEKLYETKLPENPKSKWDTSDSEVDSPPNADVEQKKKVLKKTMQKLKEKEETNAKEDNKAISSTRSSVSKSKKSDKNDRDSSESRSRSRSRGKGRKKDRYSRSHSHSSRRRGRSYSSSSYSSRSRSRSYSRSYTRSRSRSHRRHHSRSDSYSSYSDYSRSRSRSSRSRSYSSRSSSHSRRYSYSRSRSRSSSYSRSRSRSRSYRRSHHRKYSSDSDSHSDAGGKKKRYRTKKAIQKDNVEKKDDTLDIPLPNLEEEKSAENLVQKIKDKKQQNSDLVKKGLEASIEAEKENKNVVEGKDYFDIPLPTAEQVKSESTATVAPPPPPPNQGDVSHYGMPPPQYGPYGPHPYDDYMYHNHSMRYPPPPHGMRMPPHRMPPHGMFRGRGPPPHPDMRYGPPHPMMNGPRGMPPHMHDGYHPRGYPPYRYPPPHMNRDDKPPLPPSRSPSPQPPEPTKEEKEIQPNPSIVIPPEQAEQYKRLQEQAQKHAGKQLKRLKKMEAGEPYSESSSEEEEEEAKQEEQSNDGTEELTISEEIPQRLVAIPSPSLTLPQQTFLIANPQVAGGLTYAAPQLVQAGATPQHVLIPQGVGLNTALALGQTGHPLQAGAPMFAMPQTSISALAAAAAAGAQPAHLPGAFAHPMLTPLGAAQPSLVSAAAHPLLAPSPVALPQSQFLSNSALAGLQTPSPVIVGNQILVPRIVRSAL